MTAAVVDAANERIVRYNPRGAAVELMQSRVKIVAMSGPAGTGKSLAALFKLHLAALAMPDLRGLIVRQTHVSLTSTTLITFEKEVAAAALEAGVVTWFGGSGRQPAAYRYANGSTITVGGLDKPVKFMGGQYDRIVIDEATEITETALELLSTRLRADTPTYKQLIMCCNPDAPGHWLNQRAAKGAIPMLQSRHRDNPAYFRADGTMTARGADYMAVLDALTGVRRLRLLDGIWAAAEGVIYDTFDTSVHLIDKPTFSKNTPLCSAGLPWDWARYWSIDFGFTHPFVLQRWAMDGDGRLYRYAEIYRTQRLVEDHAADVLAEVSREGTKAEGLAGKRFWTEPHPQAVICDHDAEGRATFEEKSGLATVAARKAVKEGLQAVQSRLKLAGDGRARLFLIRDACGRKDQSLVDKALPACTEDEIGGYVWDGTKEQPVKEKDDGCDTKRYLVMHVDHGRRHRIKWVS
ncbi:MAG TPA: phage terminase large subunit [Pseudonocardiaceae bacterium]|jgi:phage terminase large subunit|nr:phage terminase large subunit [Pseudonocardiaceae bacterium]